jgi:UDP-glucose 4-epimerase
MVRKWLITGGCGFIGRNLISRLLSEQGNYIRIIDNLSVGSEKDLQSVAEFITTNCTLADFPVRNDTSVELVVGDILDEPLAFKLTEGMDIIVHLAANTGVAPSVKNPRFDCVTNVIGTLNYLEAARLNKVNRFVFASSGAPAGECEPPIHEELPPHPVSPYGASKLAGEGYCSAYFRTFGVETVALRFSNVYGPLSTMKDSVVAKFIKRILDGKDMEIYGDGSQTRDFIYIDDLIRALLSAADESRAGGETFQIATAKETSVSELADSLIAIFKEYDATRSIEINYSEPRVGDVKRNFSDTTKARTLLGWSPAVPLEDGLRRTINWFMENAPKAS